MGHPTLEQIAAQLESADARDRMLALAALREVAPEDAVPLIKRVLNDMHMPLRSMAIFALGVKPTAECYGLLLNLLTNDPDYSIRAEAAGALGYLGDPRALEPLLRVFYEDTNWLVRFSAAVSLGNLKDPRAKDALVQALDSPDVMLHQAAISALGELREVSAIDSILRFAQAEDWLTRQRLAEALGNLPCDQSKAALKFLEKDNHPQVAAAATFSLDRLATESSEI